MRRLLLVFTLCFALPLFAFDKSQQAVVMYAPTQRTVAITVNGTRHDLIKLTKDQIQDAFDVNPAINEVNKLTADGWLVTDHSYAVMPDGQQVFIYWLEKK